MKNYSESCERNKQPILSVLQVELATATTLLEIGSGSGQHALYFAERLPHLQWQPTERPAVVGDLRCNLSDCGLTNLQPALALDVDYLPWRVEPVSAIFSANTLHIMPLESLENFFRGVGEVLLAGGKICVYGPFNYNGNFTSASNAAFDRSLKETDPKRGIRDFEQLTELAFQNGLRLYKDHAMPSNNRLLVWQKSDEQRGGR